MEPIHYPSQLNEAVNYISKRLCSRIVSERLEEHFQEIGIGPSESLPIDRGSLVVLKRFPCKVFPSIREVLRAANLDCVETLGGKGPLAGQCQFSSIAELLVDNNESIRLDSMLRQLACYVISTNPEMYHSFLTEAGGRTRSSSIIGGEGVDINKYLSNMRMSSTDGDAITLQALCDALDLQVRIVTLERGGGRDRTRRTAAATDAVSSKTATTTDEVDDDTTCEESEEDDDEEEIDSSSSSSSSLLRNDCVVGLSAVIRGRKLRQCDYRIASLRRMCSGRLLHLAHLRTDEHYMAIVPSSFFSSPPSINVDECSEEKIGDIDQAQQGQKHRQQQEPFHRMDPPDLATCESCYCFPQEQKQLPLFYTPAECNHTLCQDCASVLQSCPTCRLNFDYVVSTEVGPAHFFSREALVPLSEKTPLAPSSSLDVGISITTDEEAALCSSLVRCALFTKQNSDDIDALRSKLKRWHARRAVSLKKHLHKNSTKPITTASTTKAASQVKRVKVEQPSPLSTRAKKQARLPNGRFAPRKSSAPAKSKNNSKSFHDHGEEEKEISPSASIVERSAGKRRIRPVQCMNLGWDALSKLSYG